jgi:hypothetical protein
MVERPDNDIKKERNPLVSQGDGEYDKEEAFRSVFRRLILVGTASFYSLQEFCGQT